MKKNYKKPYIKATEVNMRYGIMFGGSGEIDAGNAMGKETDEVVEDDETSLVEKDAAPMAFSNNYLKKVWD
jgi:hypothetical protein